MGKVLCVTPDTNYEKEEETEAMYMLLDIHYIVYIIFFVDIHSNCFFFISFKFHFPSTSSRHQCCVCVSVCVQFMN